MARLHLLILLLIFCLTTTAVAGNSDAVPLIAAYRPDGHLYIFGLEEEPVRVTEEPIAETYLLWEGQRFNYNHVWSPDGAYLVFVGHSDLPGSLGYMSLQPPSAGI